MPAVGIAVGLTIALAWWLLGPPRDTAPIPLEDQLNRAFWACVCGSAMAFTIAVIAWFFER